MDVNDNIGFVLLSLSGGSDQESERKTPLSLISDKQSQSGRSVYLGGFVLAGGDSRRMGRPKAALLIDGETLLDRQIRLLRLVARRVAVVGGPPKSSKYFNVPLVPDLVTGRGPLAGIHTALLETRREFNFVLGCDLPFVNRRLLEWLALRAIASGSDVTVPRSREGRLQPLCAVYRRRALYAVRTSLAAGENKPRSFFPKVRCIVISWQELARAGFQPSIFGNLNTPEDYEDARKRIEGSSMISGTGFRHGSI